MAKLEQLVPNQHVRLLYGGLVNGGALLHGSVLFCTVALLSLMIACSPTLNWRSAQIEDTALHLMLPCKPDWGQRKIDLAGQRVELKMLGCEAQGHLLAVSTVRMDDGVRLEVAEEHWKKATLLNIQAKASRQLPLSIKGLNQGEPSVLMIADGLKKDGQATQMQSTWFSKGRQLFHAVVYAKVISPEVSDGFFAGLEFK